MSELKELNSEQVKGRVKYCIAEILGCNIDDIKDKSDLYYDLGIHSMDAVEIIMELEKEFNICISDDELSNVKVFGECCSVVLNCIIKKHASDVELKGLSGFTQTQLYVNSTVPPNSIDIDILSKNIANNPGDFSESDIKRYFESYAYNKLQNYISSNKTRSKESESDLKFIKKALKLAIKELDSKNKIIDRKVDRKLITAKYLIEKIL